jgi:hypothetical protein
MLVAEAAGVAGHIAAMDEFRATIAEQLDLNTLISNMSITDANFQLKACRCLYNLCTSHETQVHVMELGVSAPLLRLCRNTNTQLRKAVILTLSRLTENVACCRILIKRRVILPLVDAGKSCDSMINRRHTFNIIHASNATENCAALSTDPETQVAGVRALANIASGGDVRASLIEHAILPRFFIWASEKHPEKVYHGLRGVAAFTELFVTPSALKLITVDDLAWLSGQSGITLSRVV